MPQSILQVVGSASTFETLPVTVKQQFSMASALMRLAVLLPALLLVLVPVASLILSATGLSLLAQHPVEALVGVGGALLFLTLFGLPFARTVDALARRRTVRIEAGFVTVEDRGLFGSRSWTLPLGSYKGVAHLVRTHLSGARHELVLLHQDRSRQVIICAAERLSDVDLARASSLLSLPLVPANDLYQWSLQAPASPDQQAPQMAQAVA